MSYEKNTWANGDVITAQKLNNIEQGIEVATNSGVLPIYWDGRNGTLLDKTWQEIYDAIYAGNICAVFIKIEGELLQILLEGFVSTVRYTGEYEVTVITLEDNQKFHFTCSAPNEYPAYPQEQEEEPEGT